MSGRTPMISSRCWRPRATSLACCSMSPMSVRLPNRPPRDLPPDSPAVQALAFSLSKPFGVYYDRIGGVLCRNAMPSLFGNQWFKNLTSLQLGAALLERHDVFDLPRRYKNVQREAAAQVGRRLGLTLAALRRQRTGAGRTQFHHRSRACRFPAPAGRRSRCTLAAVPDAGDGRNDRNRRSDCGHRRRIVKNPVILDGGAGNSPPRAWAVAQRADPRLARRWRLHSRHRRAVRRPAAAVLRLDRRPARARAFLFLVGRHHEPHLRQSGDRGSLSAARDVPCGLHALLPRHRLRRLSSQDGRQRVEGQRVLGDPGLFRAAALARTGLCASDLCRSLPDRSVDADAVAEEQAGRDRNACRKRDAT